MLVQCWTGNKARVILLLDMLFLRHHLKAINVPNSSAERESFTERGSSSLFSGSELSKQKSSGASTEMEQRAVLVFHSIT